MIAPQPRASFPKTSRLCKQAWVATLFKQGVRYRAGRLVLLYTPILDMERDQVLFSIGRQAQLTAVKRNALKRRLREAYRLLARPAGPVCRQAPYYALAFLYTGRGPLPIFQLLKSDMQQLLGRLAAHRERQMTC